jgi:hypothetical protein
MSGKFYLDADAERVAVGSSASLEFKGKVFGATDYADAISAALTDTTEMPALLSVAANTGYGMVTFNYLRASAQVDPIIDKQSSTGSQPGTWAAVVRYDLLGYSKQPRQVGDVAQTFEIGRDMVKRFVSLTGADAHSYGPSGGLFPPPNLKGLINIDGEGNVQGVEVPVPTYKWTETHYVDDSFVTNTFKANVYSVAANPISNVTFRSFAAYEPLFLGLSGSQRHAGGDWELNFSFAASPNQTALTIGGITGINKRGWQYVWPRSVMSVQTVSGVSYMVPKVQQVYVDDVIGSSGDGSSDFSLLGI